MTRHDRIRAVAMNASRKHFDILANAATLRPLLKNPLSAHGTSTTENETLLLKMKLYCVPHVHHRLGFTAFTLFFHPFSLTKKGRGLVQIPTPRPFSGSFPPLPTTTLRGTMEPMSKLTQQGKTETGRSGQAMIEYVIVFVAMLGVVAVLALFLYAVRLQSNRALDLVASEYP